MAIRTIANPIQAVACDGPGCHAEVRAQTWDNEWGMRLRAAAQGWQTRPSSGKGSRSAPDLCPSCAASCSPSTESETPGD